MAELGLESSFHLTAKHWLLASDFPEFPFKYAFGNPDLQKELLQSFLLFDSTLNKTEPTPLGELCFSLLT